MGGNSGKPDRCVQLFLDTFIKSGILQACGQLLCLSLINLSIRLGRIEHPAEGKFRCGFELLFRAATQQGTRERPQAPMAIVLLRGEGLPDSDIMSLAAFITLSSNSPPPLALEPPSIWPSRPPDCPRPFIALPRRSFPLEDSPPCVNTLNKSPIPAMVISFKYFFLVFDK
jgi:hypothetical protein